MPSMDLGELWRSLKRKKIRLWWGRQKKNDRVVHDHEGFQRPCPGISRGLECPKCSGYHMS